VSTGEGETKAQHGAMFRCKWVQHQSQDMRDAKGLLQNTNLAKENDCFKSFVGPLGKIIYSIGFVATFMS
jgi:hypothetical protein